MVVSYKLGLDKAGRKLAFKVEDGKKTRINYKVAQNRQRGVRYRAKKIEDQRILDPYGLDVMETRKRVRETVKRVRKTPEYEKQPIKEVESSVFARIIDKAKKGVGRPGKLPEEPVREEPTPIREPELTDDQIQARKVAVLAQENPELVLKGMQGKSVEEIEQWALKRIEKHKNEYILVRYFYLLRYPDRLNETPFIESNTEYLSPTKENFSKAVDDTVGIDSWIRDEGYILDKEESGVCIRWIREDLRGFTSKPVIKRSNVRRPYQKYMGCYKYKT